MKFFYAAWIAEKDGLLTRGGVVVCDEEYFNIVNLMANLTKEGQIWPVVVSFQEIEREHVLQMMGEEALRNMEISFKRSKIKAI